MNTPTHVLINWTVAKALRVESFPASAVLLGSVAPDLPLYGLSIGGALWFRNVEGMHPREVARHMFGHLFYHDPVWISLHNLLHSPLVVVLALISLFFALGKARFVVSWPGWFFGACLLHTMVDIAVHHDDGPLVFWPFHWSYRFSSPISYWDPAHHASIVFPSEVLLALGLAVRLIWIRYRTVPGGDETS